MNTRVFLGTLFRVFILGLISVLLVGCYDLGGFAKGDSGDGSEMSDHEFEEYYKEYYDTFEDIVLFKQNCESDSYSIRKSFFNKECTENTRTWDQNDDCVDFDEYCYVVIEFKKDIKIDSISLYLKAKDLESATDLNFYVFIVDSFGSDTDYRTYNKWQEELEKEEDERKNISDYDDLDIEDAYAKRKVSVNSNGWSSFTIGFLEKGNSELNAPYEFEKGDKVVFMFVNNMGIGLDEGLQKIKFSATNFLVRANED